ncbi:MAG: aldo/keto reductase [Bryobacteraceae bacterium]|nr:aldo/keto reductase [Bryobacteraceae bacterium]
MTSGFCTSDGSTRFTARHQALAGREFYRRTPAGLLSSIGLGTYLGKPDEAASARYVEAILAALNGGINVFDTAINYRYTRSEQDLGEALRRAFQEGLAARDEVLVCTKAGFLTAGAVPSNLHPSHIVADSHCIEPEFLSDQAARSRANLRLDTIDVLYLHNPETQLRSIPLAKFEDRIAHAFERLEKLCTAGHIRHYGVATWNAFRLKPGQDERLSLPRLIELARNTAGEDHHFRFIQLPLNLAMPEAFTYPHALLDGEGINVLEVAARSGITVVASASLNQARLVNGLPARLRSRWSAPQTDAEFALQFARSAPGVTTALAGMGQTAHVRENLAVGAYPPAPASDWLSIFQREQ